jgi:hypothetical protein
MPYYLGPFPNVKLALKAEHYAWELRTMELLVQGGMPYYLGPFPNVNTLIRKALNIFIYLSI